MPFEFRKLSVLSYANGNTFYYYRTDDKEITEQYFDAATHVKNGDVILAISAHDTQLVTIRK